MLNKVPEITLYFWVIKILATTVGETAADFLNTNIGLGLTGTTLIMSGFLAVALFFQFRLRLYVPVVYWLAVVLISVVGTLITDNLVDNFGVSLPTTTIVFSDHARSRCSRSGTRARGRSRSTRSSRPSARRSTGLRCSSPSPSVPRPATSRPRGSHVGYWKSALLFAALIAVVFVAHLRFRLNAILAFWIAYILTRPLGASIGDYLSQPSCRRRPRPRHDRDERHLPARDPGASWSTSPSRRRTASSSIPRRVRAMQRLPAIRACWSSRTRPLPRRPDRRGARARRRRAASFFLLVPNPDHLAFDRNSRDVREGSRCSRSRCRCSRQAAGRRSRVGSREPERLRRHRRRARDEQLRRDHPLDAPEPRVHWLHVDLPQRDRTTRLSAHDRHRDPRGERRYVVALPC